MRSVWAEYQSGKTKSPSVSGRIFEYAIAETLAQASIKPFYYQAQVAFVPNVGFDFVLYDPVRPVVLSAKTSLRERYKQADLEGLAIKSVYRKARSILLTLNETEAQNVEEKIEDGQVAGLDNCVVADSVKYDDLLAEFAKENYSTGREVKPINGQLCM